MQTKDTSKWSWLPCNFPLKTQLSGNLQNLSLTPMIALSHPREDGPDPIVKLVIETEKRLQYSDNLGWNWHKSWNLPSISATLEVSDPDTKEVLYAPKNIFAHIFAVKAILDNSNSLYFVDVGLRGTNKIELFDGKATFSTLKFASTSYNNEGVKFHLLVVLYLELDEGEPPKILRAVVSPPIFVDSRKSVRENQKLNESKLYMYIEPFYPDHFVKKFIKRETKKKESIEGDIENNIEGLYSYLTAPNIRHKVKHPIFLCVRFSDCITLYYNPDEVRFNQIENIAEHLQNLLYQDLDNISNNRDYSVEESMFVLLINRDLLSDLSKRKKILEFLGPVKGKGLSIVFCAEEVPANFIKYENLEGLKEQYDLAFSKLISKNRIQFGSDATDLTEPPSNKDEGSERQLIEISADLDKNPADLSLFFDTSFASENPQKKIKHNPEEEPGTNVINTANTSVPTSNVKDEKIEKPATNSGTERSTVPNANLNINDLLRNPFAQFQMNAGGNLPSLNSALDPTNSRGTQNIINQPIQPIAAFSGIGSANPQGLDSIAQQLLQMSRGFQNRNAFGWMPPRFEESYTHNQIPSNNLNIMQNNLLNMQQLHNYLKETQGHQQLNLPLAQQIQNQSLNPLQMTAALNPLTQQLAQQTSQQFNAPNLTSPTLEEYYAQQIRNLSKPNGMYKPAN